MALGGFLVRARVLCSRVFGGMSQWPCFANFVMALYRLFFVRYPRVLLGGPCGTGVGFTYILMSAVAYGTQAHGEMLASWKPHDQKTCGVVRDLVGQD